MTSFALTLIAILTVISVIVFIAIPCCTAYTARAQISRHIHRKVLLTAVIVGVLYGGFLQLLARFPASWKSEVLAGTLAVMSFGYVFIYPFVLGVLTLFLAPPESQRSWLYRIFAPWATTSVSVIMSILVGWEGAICALLAILMFMPLASLGGIIMGIIACRMQRRTINRAIIPFFIVLPMLSSAIESRLTTPIVQYEAHSDIDIQARPFDVWQQIIRVPKIIEPLDGFFYRIGFPKPVEATLSHEGIGGVRQATFEGGLEFIETVTSWENERLLGFDIKVDPSKTPATTLDPHVTVGGSYFDVLHGEYEIVPHDDNSVTLRLHSRFIVATQFNWYAGMWAKLLMKDIQQTILKVIKGRAETAAGR